MQRLKGTEFVEDVSGSSFCAAACDGVNSGAAYGKLLFGSGCRLSVQNRECEKFNFAGLKLSVLSELKILNVCSACVNDSNVLSLKNRKTKNVMNNSKKM